MRLADKIATMARRGAPLPYLRRVAYLESHGTEWINTGLKLITGNGEGASFEFGIEFDSVTGRELMLTNGQGYFGHDGSSFEYCGNRTGLVSLGRKYNVICEISKDDVYHHSLTVDGEKVLDFNTNRSTYDIYVYLFTILSSGVPSTSFAMSAKLFDFKAFYNGELVRNLIPALDFSGRPCFYNQAPSSVPADDHSRFFYNQGTGEFTWGELET